MILIVASALLVAAGLFRLWRWIQEAPAHPDPWDAEAGVDLDAAESRPLCTRCLSPHEETDWFCPQCGKAASPTTNWMPYLDELSLGDVLRHGTDGRIPVKPLTIIGYVVLSLTQYLVFAPIYWWRLWRNVERLKQQYGNPSPAPPPVTIQP